MSKFKITGLDKLEAGLRHGYDLTDVKTIVKANGANMQANTQKFAPVDTGTLKRGITETILDGGLTAKVESGVYYDAYQELGTRFQSGTPHFRPAYEIQAPIFISDLRKIMK